MDAPMLESIAFAMGGAMAFKFIELLDWCEGDKRASPEFKILHFWLPFLIRPILAAGLAAAYVASGNALTAPLLLKAVLSRRLA
jgi:hypothetical protein